MTRQQKIAVSRIVVATVNARTTFDTAREAELGENMKEHGQHQPILVKKRGDSYELIDGERRWRGAQITGIAELDSIILENPTDDEILIAQMNIDLHRVGLSPMERSNQLQRIKDKKQWSVLELSQHLHIQQPQVTKLLAYQKLHPLAQAALHEGRICTERAYILSSISDQTTQLELLGEAASLSRDQLRRKAHSDETVEFKAHKATFRIPSGIAVVVQGGKFGITEIIDALQQVAKELRQAQKAHLDVMTVERVMRDKAAVQP